LKKVELQGCTIETDRYYDPPCLKQAAASVAANFSGMFLMKTFFAKAG
jgi:hypothetical protein